MSTVIYPAIVSGDDQAGYSASFPDLAGCAASGAHLGELIANARDAVTAHLRNLADEGGEWPKPRPPAEVRADAGGAVFLVDVQVEDTPVRVNISIGEDLLKRLDAAAEARGATRSGFIAHAVRASLGERPRAMPADFDAAARQVRDELSAFGRRLSDRLGPDSAFSRSMADLDDRVLETVRKAADSVSAAIARRREATARRGAEAKPEPHEDSAAQI